MTRHVVTRQVEVVRTPRIMQLEGLFDLPEQKYSAKSWSVDVPLDERPWNVGLIVGPSGAGKSTLAVEMFGERATRAWTWPTDRSVVEGFPKERSIKDITELLSSVGFSSPPSWLRPYHALSTGEKFRCDLSRALASDDDPIVVDEFTSVVDRTVAQVGSAAVARSVRKAGRKFVAVSCHYDILEWLQPDWVLEPATGEFHWRELRPRPTIELEITELQRRAVAEAWRIFGPHHYLSSAINACGQTWVATWRDRPVAMTCAIPFPHGTIKNGYREHRTVCLPDFQGVGIGNTMSNWVGGWYRAHGKRFFSTTTHPAMIRHRAKSPLWRMFRAPSIVNGKRGPNSQLDVTFGFGKKRLTASFEYVGAPLGPEWSAR